MIDKGHCFMSTENFEEYGKFYDFSEQLKDLEHYDKRKYSDNDQHEIEIVSGEEDSDWSEENNS